MAENKDEKTPQLQAINSGYNVDNTHVLTAVEAVRHRPGMYIGDTGTWGLHHLFKEVLDSAIDEVLAGHCTEIKVVYGADQSLSVEDNGRGISVDIHKETGKTWVELFLFQLSHRTTFGEFGDGTYRASCYNVGVSCTNALSTWLECEVQRDGKVHWIRFERGVLISPLTVVGKCAPGEHGTKITWLADDSVFALALDENGHLNYSPTHLRNRIRKLAYLNPGVALSFHDVHSGQVPETYQYKRGIVDLIVSLNAAKQYVHPTIVSFCDQQEDTQIEIAFQYHHGDEETIHSFVNMIPLSEGGTHVTGFKNALTRTLNQYARKNGLLTDNDTNFSGDAIHAGLTAVLSLRMTNPSFAGASKDRLINPEMVGKVNRAVHKFLAKYLEENPEEARAIVKHTYARRKRNDKA